MTCAVDSVGGILPLESGLHKARISGEGPRSMITRLLKEVCFRGKKKKIKVPAWLGCYQDRL